MRGLSGIGMLGASRRGFMSEPSMHYCKLTDALVIAAIWTLFILVLAPVSAVAWGVVWWYGE
ncbi:hypothetical protein CFR72_06475 [Gluconacetobacter entanii]|uniref:Uncharacterized protein n=1 Tax=Gluconacetobacter entanii TaxID=108528 RepID=A0A318PYU2_9PROT|nr:hypothetical protein CFR72_06475 [Gluconacetobacter entanii]